MKKVILVLLDGLNDKIARKKMGYMAHLVEQNIASKYTVACELPAMSRPLYETILTGTPVLLHGVSNNQIIRKSHMENIFSLCYDNGLTTGAAAYHWISELYNESPFNPERHRHQYNPSAPIQHGVFYWADDYPDSHLFIDCINIINTYHPHFVLLHSMNIDLAGHQEGGSSSAYVNAAITADSLLSMSIPKWQEQGYDIIITADHGMDNLGLHCGISSLERHVPLWLIGDSFTMKTITASLSQLLIAPMICELLKLPIPEIMIKKGLGDLLKGVEY